MTSLLSTLKQSTWPYHKRLEAKVNWLKPGLSHTEYCCVLEKFWGFYQPMERRLLGLTELLTWLPDLPRRSKLPKLKNDLNFLGLDNGRLEQLPLCSELSPCSDVASAFGCLYVIEGSTLGAQVISQHLQRALNLDAQTGAAFFNGYADETEFMWQVFKENLSAAPVNEQVLIQSACETFTTLEKWLCQA